MSESFGITYEVVYAAAQQLRAQTTALTEVVEQMQSTARNQFAEWNALSVDTYVTTQRTWEQQAGTMSADLEASISRLLAKVSNYQEADQQAARI